jgi:hypothetical protein
VDGAQYQVLVFEGGKSAAIIYTLMKRDRNHVWRIEGLAAHGTPIRQIPKSLLFDQHPRGNRIYC